jgi:ECF transporter S component (folate family)
MKHTKKIVIIAMLIAADIVLTRFLSVQIPPVSPVIRLSFGFIPIALMGMLFGPLYAGIGAAVSDFTGVMLFPPPGASFFPGFTLTAFLTGITYGLLLHKQPVKAWRIFAAAYIVTVGLNLILDTIWLEFILENGVFLLIPFRVLRTAVMLPLQLLCLRYITGERFKGILKSVR